MGWEGRTMTRSLSFMHRIEERHGCSYSEWLSLKSIKPSPIRSFVDQRSNAKKRGISWEMNLSQWWSAWQMSGHWEERGRGAHSYCMSRKGDIGPYSIDNVFIGMFRQNSSDKPQKKSDLPIGVTKARNSANFYARRNMRGKMVFFGSYQTPEEAHAAYLRAWGEA